VKFGMPQGLTKMLLFIFNKVLLGFLKYDQTQDSLKR
jgi:hypothetical protein